MSKKKNLRPVPTPITPADGGGNGSGHSHPHVYAIGSVVPVPDPALESVTPLLGRINALQQQLGGLQEDYEARCMGLLQALAKERQAYGEQIKKTGIDLGINLGPDSQEAWMFDPQKKAFTRQA